MFVQPRDEPALVETGAMTSDLRPSEFIQEFVSAGPKNYAYKIVDSATGEGKTVCKIRGITLNCIDSQLINFEVVKDKIWGKTETGKVRGRQEGA